MPSTPYRYMEGVTGVTDVRTLADELAYLRTTQHICLAAAARASSPAKRTWHYLGAQDHFIEELYLLGLLEARP